MLCICIYIYIIVYHCIVMPGPHFKLRHAPFSVQFALLSAIVCASRCKEINFAESPRE